MRGTDRFTLSEYLTREGRPSLSTLTPYTSPGRKRSRILGSANISVCCTVLFPWRNSRWEDITFSPASHPGISVPYSSHANACIYRFYVRTPVNVNTWIWEVYFPRIPHPWRTTFPFHPYSPRERKRSRIVGAVYVSVYNPPVLYPGIHSGWYDRKFSFLWLH